MNLSKEAIRNPLCFTKSPEEPQKFGVQPQTLCVLAKQDSGDFTGFVCLNGAIEPKIRTILSKKWGILG
jgi:hypothetical protein